MTAGHWVLVASVVLALAVGGWRSVSDGRFRGTHRVRGVVPGPAATAGDGPGLDAPAGDGPGLDAPAADGPGLDGLGLELGGRATLLQFSSAFCAPCRATRQTLAGVAEAVPGVVHVELDAEHHLDLVRRLGILRTPTTLVLDATGREVTRASGAPRRDQVLGVLAELV